MCSFSDARKRFLLNEVLKSKMVSAKCSRICIVCGPEDGAWIVGAYTVILGIIGMALLVSAEAWDRQHIFGPVGMVLFFLLFVAAFLLFYGMYRKSIVLLYVWTGIFLVNFASHLVVWIITIVHWTKTPITPVITDHKKDLREYKFFLVEIIAGSICLLLSIWSFATMVVVISRLHDEHEQLGHMTRPFSFRHDHDRPHINNREPKAIHADDLKISPMTNP